MYRRSTNIKTTVAIINDRLKLGKEISQKDWRCAHEITDAYKTCGYHLLQKTTRKEDEGDLRSIQSVCGIVRGRSLQPKVWNCPINNLNINWEFEKEHEGERSYRFCLLKFEKEAFLILRGSDHRCEFAIRLYKKSASIWNPPNWD